MDYQTLKERHGVSYFNRKNEEFLTRLKRKAKFLFGNKCQKCGYFKSQNALAFHHVDSTTKEFNISDFYKSKCKNGKYAKSIKIFALELNKCVLLCQNCHNEVHENILDISSIERIFVIEDQLRIRKKKCTPGGT